MSDAQRIRQAIYHLTTVTLAEGDQLAQWAISEVMDAAEKYADHLEDTDE